MRIAKRDWQYTTRLADGGPYTYDPPIAEQEYVSGMKIINIGDVRVARGMSRHDMNKAPPDSEQLMADNVLMALALQGITPDRNAQTEAEVAETEEAIWAACCRALPLMGS